MATHKCVCPAVQSLSSFLSCLVFGSMSGFFSSPVADPMSAQLSYFSFASNLVFDRLSSSSSFLSLILCLPNSHTSLTLRIFCLSACPRLSYFSFASYFVSYRLSDLFFVPGCDPMSGHLSFYKFASSFLCLPACRSYVCPIILIILLLIVSAQFSYFSFASYLASARLFRLFFLLLILCQPKDHFSFASYLACARPPAQFLLRYCC